MAAMSNYERKSYISHLFSNFNRDSYSNLELKRNYVYGYEIKWPARSNFSCKGRIFMGPANFRWLTYLIIIAIIGI